MYSFHVVGISYPTYPVYLAGQESSSLGVAQVLRFSDLWDPSVFTNFGIWPTELVEDMKDPYWSRLATIAQRYADAPGLHARWYQSAIGNPEWLDEARRELELSAEGVIGTSLCSHYFIVFATLTDLVAATPIVEQFTEEHHLQLSGPGRQLRDVILMIVAVRDTTRHMTVALWLAVALVAAIFGALLLFSVRKPIAVILAHGGTPRRISSRLALELVLCLCASLPIVAGATWAMHRLQASSIEALRSHLPLVSVSSISPSWRQALLLSAEVLVIFVAVAFLAFFLLLRRLLRSIPGDASPFP